MQKCEQNADRFLFIPGKHQSQRQIIHAAAKCFGQGNCYLDCTVRIVALPHIHDTRKTADRSQIKIVKTIFSTGKGKHSRVRRSLFHKFRIITPATARTVTSADKENVF